MNNINCRMPVVALKNLVIMPETMQHFEVSRKKSIAAVEASMSGDMLLMLSMQQDPGMEDPHMEDLFSIGTVVRIKQIVKMPKNTIRVMVESQFRAELEQEISASPYLLCDVIIHDTQDHIDDEAESMAIRDYIEEQIRMLERSGAQVGQDVLRVVSQAKSTVSLVNQLCGLFPMPMEERQILLETFDFKERYENLCRIIIRYAEIAKIRNELQDKVKDAVDKNQREYILREQMKVIRQELGEDVLSEADEFSERLEKLKAPAEVKEKLAREIGRYKNLAGSTAESGVYRNYIETLLEMPWLKSSRDNKDLEKAARVLREDHYGLEKVKSRILEYIAVRMLSKKSNGPILCLVGPPGTGKTSIARSVARALNKKYVRISLGGLHDEAEIRGHRKTYIGAMPGRIATAMKQAGVRNPVMLLDEIDKVGTDYKGDAFSAMLEVLDPEQNCNFRDNYLEVPLDLSDVLFIATANSLSTIPRPLLDRMEVIEINTYTQNEKLHIAREHLVDKQLIANGIGPKQLVIGDKAIESIIEYYTREAGVRQLERYIGEICRKTAMMLLSEGRKRVKVTDRNIESFLGPKRYKMNPANEKNEVGIVRGLAWTSVGGDTLSIEVNIMPGKGVTQLTGQLGDVMKESAQTGLSYIRSIAPKFGIEPEFFEKHDIHIHIPEGAVPKDGPSAGVTMATAMLSAITGIPVKADVAMTGEITLRGRVLPIGGLREKTIAAKVAGIHTVIIPEKNRSDLKELDKEITKDMRFVYASAMTDILPVAFEKMPQL